MDWNTFSSTFLEFLRKRKNNQCARLAALLGLCPAFDLLKLTEQIPHRDESKVSLVVAVWFGKLLTRVDCSPNLKKKKKKLPTIGMSLKILLSLKGMSVSLSTQWRGRSGSVVWIQDLDYATASLAVDQTKCLNFLKERVVSPDKFGRTTQLAIRIYSTPSYIVLNVLCISSKASNTEESNQTNCPVC